MIVSYLVWYQYVQYCSNEDHSAQLSNLLQLLRCQFLQNFDLKIFTLNFLDTFQVAGIACCFLSSCRSFSQHFWPCTTTVFYKLCLRLCCWRLFPTCSSCLPSWQRSLAGCFFVCSSKLLSKLLWLPNKINNKIILLLYLYWIKNYLEIWIFCFESILEGKFYPLSRNPCKQIRENNLCRELYFEL